MIPMAPRLAAARVATLGLVAALAIAAPVAARTPAQAPAQAPGQAPARGQAPAAKPAPAGPPATAGRPAASRAPYAMTVKQEQGFINIGLKAQGAKVTDVAADLAKRLKLRISVGPGFAQETLTLDFPESIFESALTQIAPHAIVEYEFRADARPKPLMIYLLGANDTAPETTVAKPGAAQGLLITGHTEENPANAAEDAVKVSGDARNGVSVKAVKQPLGLVAMVLADILGVQLEMQYGAEEIVDVDVQNAAPEDAVAALSPNARLIVRVDLSMSERTPLRLVLAKPGAER
jgi:hypothetical protein